MRERHGPDHQRHAMWAAMGDWLDHEATSWVFDFETYRDKHFDYWREINGATVMPTKTDEHFRSIATEYADSRHRDAFKVADAYLAAANKGTP